MFFVRKDEVNRFSKEGICKVNESVASEFFNPNEETILIIKIHVIKLNFVVLVGMKKLL
ncbi:MAG: hypothetical protein KO202_01245 [Methanobacteriaceae archaeon]|nr:hypothetical protein [Methanobacteriaceae archaeon]